MNKEILLEKLKAVKDPEIGIDIVTLGLIRDIKIKEGEIKSVHALMTLTTPFCPFANDIIAEVEDVLAQCGFEEVAVDLTFDPPWEPSEELRLQLGV